MKKRVFRVSSDGFNGAWYPAPAKSSRGLIIMLGDSSEDYMARTGAKWLHEQGLHVMAMSADQKDYGHHNYPLERFGKAIAYMKTQGCEFSSARRTMYCGTPVNTSAGWRNDS